MKRLLLLCVLLIGCIGCNTSSHKEVSWHTLTLARQGGFSGLEERYQLSSDGVARKYMRFPGGPDSLWATATVDTALFARIAEYTNRHRARLDTLRLHLAGNMTTSITIQRPENAVRISWPNIDPPADVPLIDTLYSYLMQVQKSLAQSR